MTPEQLRWLIAILMESPVYWTLTVKGRLIYLRFIAATYQPRFS